MNRPEGIKPEYIKAGEALYDKIGFGAPRDAETLARAIQSSVEAERAKTDEALKELDAYLAQIGGCGDGYCIIVKPKGMHTNGGCRCSSDQHKMARYAFAVNRFITAIRSRKGA